MQFGYIGLAYLCIGILGALIGTVYLKAKKSTNYDALLKVLFTLGILGLVTNQFPKLYNLFLLNQVGLAIAGAEAPFWLIILLTILLGNARFHLTQND